MKLFAIALVLALCGCTLDVDLGAPQFDGAPDSPDASRPPDASNFDATPDASPPADASDVDGSVALGRAATIPSRDR